MLLGGMSYDRLKFPEDLRYAPVSAQEEHTERLSPKAGFIWAPTRSTAVRFAFSQSSGGVAFDQSFQLEPAQVAGFIQSYRSIIPEAVAGANAAARFEVFGLALDQKFASGTYLGLTAEWLDSQV